MNWTRDEKTGYLQANNGAGYSALVRKIGRGRYAWAVDFQSPSGRFHDLVNAHGECRSEQQAINRATERIS